jgi:PAS domain S-box-containing protein
MFGYSSAEIVGRSIRIIIPADRQTEEDDVLRRIQAGQIVDHFETIRRRKDGTQLPVSLTVSPVKNSDGRIVGASKIARDITLRREIEVERKRLLEREQAARLAADSSNRTKDDFLAMVSHELRTPLNAILGWTQIALSAFRGQDDEATKATLRQAVEVIERNAMTQARLIDDLLDISRVVSGKLELNAAPLDLTDLVVTVAESARPAADARALDLRVRLDADSAPVMGDASRLQQVLWNLVSNAIKFTPKGGAIELAVDRDPSHVRLAVRDSGVGIDPDFLPHVFERFRQADARRFGGLGLGLAVVEHLVRAHGGTVAAKSPGKGFGATFVVTLPLAPPVPSFDRPHPHTDRPVSLEGLFLLVVDDDPDARDLMRHMLQQRGAEVTSVASTLEALAAVERRRFDVLLADLGMPDHDGFELIAAIRSHSRPSVRELRAIATTAFVGEDAREKTLAGGYNDYMPKPVALDALAGAIANLVAHGRD